MIHRNHTPSRVIADPPVIAQAEYDWIPDWIAMGLRRLDAYLENHAAFHTWLVENGREATR